VTLDVLGIGTLTVDEVLTVEAFPTEDAKTRVTSRERRCGGMVGAALIAAARLGARCACAGALGDDPESAEVRAALTREGIDLSALVRDPSARPVRSTVIISRATGTRTILAQPGDPGTAPIPRLPYAVAILVDHHTPVRVLEALAFLRAQGAQIVADLERDTPQSAELDRLADHLIVPLAYARARSGCQDPFAAAGALWHARRRLVALTDGAHGAWYIANGRSAWEPACEVAAIDTSGCGDVFHGAYAAALARGLPPAERIRLASAAAALKATRRGGAQASPTLAELGPMLAERSATASSG
jgi:sugar/nucleoside kinase (ribokinase family)